MKKAIFSFLLFTLTLPSFAQFSGQLPGAKKYKFKAIFDSVYGINIYERLNPALGGDSVRNDKRGYAAQGWIEDNYEGGQLLHKGYYVDGQLKTYKNYYENGQLERVFKVTDMKRCNNQIFFQDGKIKSEVDYYSNTVQKQTDYYPNGQIEYQEENSKGNEYPISRKSFFDNGKPESIFELVDKKSRTYTKKEYYANGNPKEEGIVKYDSMSMDYVKDGTWKVYDESGKMTMENWAAGQRLAGK